MRRGRLPSFRRALRSGHRRFDAFFLALSRKSPRVCTSRSAVENLLGNCAFGAGERRIELASRGGLALLFPIDLERGE